MRKQAILELDVFCVFKYNAIHHLKVILKESGAKEQTLEVLKSN